MSKTQLLVIVGAPSEDGDDMISAVIRGCGQQGIPCRRIDDASFPEDLPIDTAVLFAGDKEHFRDVLKKCNKRDFPLIIASKDVIRELVLLQGGFLEALHK